MQVARRSPGRPRRANSASDVAAELEQRTREDLHEWSTAGDQDRLRDAVRRYLIGPRVRWSEDLAARMHRALRDLYDRAESDEVPHAKAVRGLTPGTARNVLASLLVPSRRSGRPSGSAPIVAHAVEALIILTNGRGVDRLLGDDVIVKKLRARLAALEYGGSEITDLLHFDHEAVSKAYWRRLHRR